MTTKKLFLIIGLKIAEITVGIAILAYKIGDALGLGSRYWDGLLDTWFLGLIYIVISVSIALLLSFIVFLGIPDFFKANSQWADRILNRKETPGTSPNDYYGKENKTIM